MKLSLCVALLGLAACDAAGPGFMGAEKVTREVEGSRFTLRVREDVAEAIRTSPEMLPQFDAVARKAGIAAQMETGCRAVWVEGDPAMMWIGLSCEGRPPPKRPRRPRTLFCEFGDVTTRAGYVAGPVECRKTRR